MEDAEFGRKVMQEAFNLWIGPEINRRKRDGKLPEGFQLRAAQVILDLDASAPVVRLNEEVQVVAVAVLKSEGSFKPGDFCKMGDVERLERLRLTDLDPDAAHFTMVSFRGAWHLTFDFRYNANRATQALDAAKEFIDCAAYALEKSHTRAFVDNLFSAAELMAKGQLLLRPLKAVLKGKKHSIISQNYNWWGGLGNTDPRYVRLLNDLSKLRQPARYLTQPLSLMQEKMRAMLDLAAEMYQQVRKEIPERVNVSHLE